MLGPSILYIHKLQLWTSIDLEKVDPSETFKSKPLSWSYIERIGLYDVQFTIHPNGSVMMYVISSSKPFRLYNERDVIDIITFLGTVEDKLRTLLSDPRGRFISSVSRWVLKGCDLNKDVEISRVAQITLPNLEIPFVDKAFRSYVKPMGDEVYYRLKGPTFP